MFQIYWRIACFVVLLMGVELTAMAQSRSTAPAAKNRIKVIFDCDLGDDIDDAYALALLCASPELEVLGITTCYGRTDDRAQLACQMLYEWGLDSIPVAVGRDTRQTDERANWYADQFYYAKGFTRKKPISQSAVDFIREQLRKYPGEVTVISVGPVPNMADLVKRDPGALKLAKRVVAMFGSFSIGYNGSPTIDTEWNVRADVAASRQFVSSGVPITYAGLDVTTFVKADAVFRQKLLMRQSPLTSTLCGLQTLWAYDRDPVLYDAVAVGMVLWPDLFKTQPAHVTVDDKGYTRLNPQQPANGDVAVYVNTPKFLERLLRVYMNQNLRRF
ncbi:inosine-uridine nucleoside N-ribohydrolase [Larkinella arboricola]|uniref:Inosine-uridine nucleoside N-ribohydrolase n=2 Tax=Larkinella arboricola TaxID=643671 RepID=A0A327WRB2_LARAB|nr:inosine-uridine nucleoside N-ribohydrolase [Larkinella arboricola]